MATNGSTLLEKRLPRETAAPPIEAPATRGPIAALALSFLFGALLLGGLVAIAGPWAIAANTRLLNLLIGGGIVAYHDRQAGFIEGIPHYEYYIASQDPINWAVLGIVIALHLLIWGLKAIQFDHLARHYGLGGGLGRHGRAYVYGLCYHETMPFRFGDAAAVAALRASGAPLDRARATLFLFNTLVLFELSVFALVALVGLGWATWLTEVFWAAVIFGVLALWMWPSSGKGGQVGAWRQAISAHMAGLARRPLVLVLALGLSLLSFGLRDAAGYLTTMAFSTEHVLLNIPASLLLMALVSGYVATLVRLTPGGIGQFEWGFTAALFFGGVGLAEAATVALLVSFFRYAALLLVFLSTLLWRGARASYREVLALLASPAWQAPLTAALSPAAPGAADPAPLPAQPAPDAVRLWSRALNVLLAGLGLFFLDRISLILADRWLLESLGLGNVFAINFNTGLVLFVLTAFLFSAAIAAPALLLPVSRTVRSFAMRLAAFVGLLAGFFIARAHREFLLYNQGGFGEADPVFGLDIGFYAFNLPALWVVWTTLAWLAGLALLAALICSALVRPRRNQAPKPAVERLVTTPVLASLGGLGLVAAWGIWLSRFDLLFKDNYLSSIPVGAEALDVTGLLSTRNQIAVTALAALGITIAAIVLLLAMRGNSRRGAELWSGSARSAGLAIGGLVALDLAFAAGVAVRDAVAITPNQPVVQLPYIERHLAATRAAYGMDAIEEVELRPRTDSDPMPELERMLSSPTVQNAPLWPTFSIYLERLVDPQHATRVLQTGDNKVYGPTAEIFRQEQKLRTYYDFLDVDVLRFPVDGETKVFASAVRETPILEPQPWLAWWGQRFMLFTHGHGLVMAPVAEVTPDGAPVFSMRNLPVQTSDASMVANDPRIYYGEGAGSMAISNVRDVEEFSFPTDQGRQTTSLGIDAGVPLDSPLRRLVFAWRSGEFFELLLSGLITPETRLHYYRQPIERLEHVAPFLYLDSNAYATVADGRILWMVNGLTTSDRYPYSSFEWIGDKSQSRTAQTIETRRINYVEDSVKATIDAATGKVQLYKIADSPVINAWARVYPGLFQDGATMPASVRQQLTYPMHLFHTQFDDLYIYYHMNDPMYYFNMEDMWDDADEVLGPILDEGEAITFSIEPFQLLVETGGSLPASSSGTQFALMSPFTPEGARNLRSVPMAYQDGEDYGRLMVLQVPKGEYVLGPEQADAVINQDPEISQQISWWNNKGTEVIRGHTSLMIVDGELIYVEPIFIRSKQNPVTQLKRVVAVVRGHAYMAETLEGALRTASEDLVARQAATAAGGE